MNVYEENKTYHLNVTLINLIHSTFIKISSSLCEISNLCVQNSITIDPSITYIYKEQTLSIVSLQKHSNDLRGKYRRAAGPCIFPAAQLIVIQILTNPFIKIALTLIDPHKMPCFVATVIFTCFLNKVKNLLGLEKWIWFHGR